MAQSLKNSGKVRKSASGQTSYSGKANSVSSKSHSSSAPQKRMRAAREPHLKKKTAGKSSVALAEKNTKVLPAIVAEEKVRTISDLNKKSFPTAAIFLSIICTMLFMYIIYNMVQINEYTVEQAELYKKIESLTATEKELKLEVDKRNDLRVIEKIATEEYGMVKKDKVTKLYVNVGAEDKSEAVESDSGTSAEGLIPSIMSAIGRNFFK